MAKMLAALMVALFLALVLPVSANETSDAYEACRGHAKVAALVMEQRQSGVSMIDMMDWAGDMGEFKEGSALLVRLAFDQPLMHSEAGKRRQVSEFSNKILSKCMDAKSSM